MTIPKRGGFYLLKNKPAVIKNSYNPYHNCNSVFISFLFNWAAQGLASCSKQTV